MEALAIVVKSQARSQCQSVYLTYLSNTWSRMLFTAASMLSFTTGGRSERESENGVDEPVAGLADDSRAALQVFAHDVGLFVLVALGV